MSIAIVIGNIVRGFRVISGFESDEEAHAYVAENRSAVGAEYRVAEHAHWQDLLPLNPAAPVQDPLKFEKPAPGEAVDPNTGVSIDLQDHKEKKDANPGPAGADSPGADQVGSGSGGDGAPVPDLRGAGEPGPGPGTDGAADSGNAVGGDGAGGAEAVAEQTGAGAA